MRGRKCGEEGRGGEKSPNMSLDRVCATCNMHSTCTGQSNGDTYVGNKHMYPHMYEHTHIVYTTPTLHVKLSFEYGSRGMTLHTETDTQTHSHSP